MSSAATEFDQVTEDALKAKAPIPPMDLAQDQRRAFLGGVFGYRNGTTISPYADPGCHRAWHAGRERERKESRGF